MAFLSAAARAPLSFLHTPGVALAVGSLYPGLLAAAPGRGLFSSAHGSAVRKINTCERERAEFFSFTNWHEPSANLANKTENQHFSSHTLRYSSGTTGKTSGVTVSSSHGA